MVVRVKLRLQRNNVIRDVIALLNSGYEAGTRNFLYLYLLARELKLWPPRYGLSLRLKRWRSA